jgi:type IV secretory pathway TrbF-like protein
MTTSSRVHLDEINDLLLAAIDVDGLRQAMLRQVIWLQEERDAQADRVQLLQLVREAHDLLTNPETRVDIRDWLRSADPFMRS